MENTTIQKINEYFASAIKDITSINSKKLPAKQYTNIIDKFAKEKYSELYDSAIEILPDNGNQSITFETICYNHSYNCAFAYQVVYKKHDKIIKYGDFYICGYVSTTLMNSSDTGYVQRIPLPSEVEFDMLSLCGNAIYARPKQGQENLDGIEGSLDNYLYIMGDNTYGALGLSDTQHRLLPEKYKFNSRVEKIYNNESSNIMQTDVFVLLKNKDLYGCGRNQMGQHGIGNTVQINSWKKIASNVDYFYTLDGSNYYVIDGNLYSAGYNDKGQLGKGDRNDGHTLTQIFKNVKSCQINRCTWWSSDWLVHKSNGLFMINGQMYGCGTNNHWQINCLHNGDILSLERIRDENHNDVDFPPNTKFSSTIDTSFYLIPNEEGNTDFYMAGNGTSGKGDGTIGSATKFSKKYTFKGLGWEIYSAYNMWNIYQEVCYVYNLQTREIYAMGHNTDCQLGTGTINSNEPKFKKVMLPNIDIKHFEIMFNINKTLDLYGGLVLIINNKIYLTGKPLYGNTQRSSSIPTLTFSMGV